MTPDDGPASPHDSTPLSLTTLGAVALSDARASGRVLLSPGKPLALITYLALAPRRLAPREHLVDLLWADLPPDKARHALRQTVWYLRQLLGAECLTTNKAGEITLALALTSDRDQFLAALEEGELERAVGIYQGEFLAGFAAPGGVEFEHWADVERQRLRSAFLRAAETLARRYLDQARFREAQQLARRARDAAKSTEAVWRLLLETHAATGDQLGFAMEASGLSLMLAADQREPEPATRALLSRGQDDRPDPGGIHALNPALVGREREFAAIITAWESISREGGRHFHLSAPPGLGKSRLLSDVHRRLRGLGAMVVALRANPGDRSIPYSYLGEIARLLGNLPGAVGISPASASSLVALNPALSSRFAAQADAATGGEALRRRASALTELLTTISEEQPCALLLDDLHWADAASRQAIRPLLERAQELPTLIVSAARPVTEPGPAIDAARSLPLPPLTVAQTGEVLASLGQLPVADWSLRLPEELTRATGGSPLLLLETLQLAVDSGWVRIHDGMWTCQDPAALARALREGSALKHRVENLDELSRRLLLILAIAGTPMSQRQLSRATAVPEPILDDALGALEQRGLAHRSGELALPAHDEIAAAALEVATTESIPSVHAGIAAALLEGANVEPADLVRAGRHFDLGGRRTELLGVFARYLAALRHRGDMRRVGEIAYEFLGEGTPLPHVLRLVRGLPVWTRLRLSSGRAAMVATVLVLLATTAFFAARGMAPVPLGLIVIERDSTGTMSAREITVDPDDWPVGQPLRVRDGHRAPVPAAMLRRPAGKVNEARPSPDRRAWAYGVHLPPEADPGVIDVFLAQGSSERRLTFTPRDDNPEDWSPDGRYLLISTARWSPPGADNYDLALIDLASGAVHRLTDTRDADYGAKWSPDGQRIAFLRTWRDQERMPSICFTTPDLMTQPRCLSPDGIVVTSNPMVWLDPDHVVVQGDSQGEVFPIELSVASAGWRRLPFVQLTAMTTTWDGLWHAVHGTLASGNTQQWFVGPAGRVDALRRLDPSSPGRSILQVFWRELRFASKYLDSLSILNPVDSLALGITARLTVAGQDQFGQQLPLRVPLRWSTTDSSVLAVSPEGLVHPVRAGSAIVRADLPGWRSTSLTLQVTGSPARVAMQEEWDDRWEERWIPSGAPRPRVVVGPGGKRALLNNGDGSYGSGAVTRQSWPAHHGLGLEIQLATPVEQLQFERLHVTLLHGGSALRPMEWDTSLALPGPDPAIGSRGLCDLEYPSMEGALGLKRLGFSAGEASMTSVVGPWIRERRWWTLRMQLMPDGRCAVAINGKPVWMSATPIEVRAAYRVVLSYAAARPTVFHGPLEIWEGVRQDIDWSVLDSLNGRALPLASRPGSH